jgi:GNAT superfamily N-acetyltransferase
MPIVNFKTTYTPDCYSIDVKSYLWPWLEEGWQQLNGYIIRVFMFSGDVVGFFSFQVIENEIIVSKLCVHPDYRNLNIGSQLHDDLVRIAKKYGKKKLKVTLHELNKHFDFIIKRGWKGVGVSRNHFPDGRDGFLFELELP